MENLQKKVKIINSKNQNIAAVIHSPNTKTEKLAILCPGFLDSKDYEHLVKLAEVLVEHGFTVVRFDPTGTWESEGAISDYTNSQYIEDIRNIIQYMLKEDNYKYILLGGHSRGGQISISYTARDSSISLVLGIMPSLSSLFSVKNEELKKWEKEGFRISLRNIPNTDKKREFHVPFSNAIDRKKYDTLEDVKKIKVPIILITGELDTTVLPESVKKIFNNANEPKKFISIPGIGHDYRHKLEEIEKVNKIIISNIGEI